MSSGFLLGVLAALVAALPAALRSSSPALVWLSLAGAAAVVLGPLLAARTALRPTPTGLAAVGLGIGFAAWPIALLLSVLKSATHHRPLGAVTFAFAALVLTAASVVAALRVFTWLRSGGVGTGLRRALVGLSLLGPLVLLVRLASDARARTSLFDVCLALGVSALVLLVPWPASFSALARRVGPLVWAAVVGIGFFSARVCREAALEASPALLAPFHWLVR